MSPIKAGVSACAANGIVSTNYNFRYSGSGTYYLGYKINDLNEVPECDTSNNVFWYWTITVQ